MIPHGTMRTGFACAELDAATMPAPDCSQIATGATRLHFRHPVADVDLTVGEIRPRLPSQMAVLGCFAVDQDHTYVVQSLLGTGSRTEELNP